MKVKIRHKGWYRLLASLRWRAKCGKVVAYKFCAKSDGEVTCDSCRTEMKLPEPQILK